tara:strand:+ start:3950 stop:4759 length:810 start_codon:yes stop_codon:yes gene_type:complete
MNTIDDENVSKIEKLKPVNRMRLHVVLTIVWLVGLLVLGLKEGLFNLQPNELGDFMAGIAAPVAFYWLIVGYFMQREELMLQRQELSLTREELSLTRDEVRRQANALERSSSLQEKSVRNDERRFAQEWLREEITSLPNRMLPLVKLAVAKKFLKTEMHENAITWLGIVGDDVTTDSLPDVLAKLERAVLGWPTDVHGPISDAFEHTSPFEFRAIWSRGIELASWYDHRKFLAKQNELEFFEVQAAGAGFTKLIRTINRLVNSDEDWLQ